MLCVSFAAEPSVDDVDALVFTTEFSIVLVLCMAALPLDPARYPRGVESLLVEGSRRSFYGRACAFHNHGTISTPRLNPPQLLNYRTSELVHLIQNSENC